MGIEKPQITTLAAYARGETPAPTPEELVGTTPNQRDMGSAIRVAWARITGRDIGPAVAADLAHLRAMEVVGHMAVGPSYGDEQGAPGPHDGLWYAGRGSSLREALALKATELTQANIRYWQVHFALCREFWTPQGPRMPCARATPAAGRPLAPTWGIDALAGNRLFGWPLAARPKVDPFTVDLLSGCHEAIPAIVAGANALGREEIPLGVTLRKWAFADGGFVAAFDHDEPMNDRLSWLRVDAAGNILAADATLSTFLVPPGDTIVIGRAAGASSASLPTSSSTPDAVAAPQPAMVSSLADLADRVHSLVVARKELAAKAGVEAAMRSVPPARAIADLADAVHAFGINPESPQAETQREVVAALRALVAKARAQ